MSQSAKTKSGSKSVSADSSSPDISIRQRVLKEVGLTSATFIGPAFPPGATKAKPDIEDTLSEFYKELEKIDTPDGAKGNPEKKKDGVHVQPIPPKPPTGKEPWPHWYHNEPYFPRRPRLDVDLRSGRPETTQNHWHHPHAPDPRFHRPPFHHRPPPSSAFPNQQKPAPAHVGRDWSGPRNQYQEEAHFPTFSNFRPPNAHGQPSQGFYEGSPHHFDRDERDRQGRSYDPHSDHINAGWERERNEEWCHVGDDYDRREMYDSENDREWDHGCQPQENTHSYKASLVLILLRGLPGSGKSTLARELLSTGPSGLILSTDDYFANRDGYRYDAGLLGAAHDWNHSRAKDAMRDGRSPIIIDNTNIQAWEMKPYVQMALEHGYKVDFFEPDTSWKFDPHELEKRNKHGVEQDKIAQMMDRFSFPISVDIVMSSQEPLHVNQGRDQPDLPHMMRRRPDFH